jgi:predicted DNA-binding antitoxin AbrB/MazE fold protein
MTQHITAIYENGVLRPLEPLILQDQQLVSVSIEQVASMSQNTSPDGPTLFEVLDEVGLVGCVKGAPPDLSTNPRFMEGFGSRGD